MIEFKDVEIQDKAWMDPLIRDGDMRGCEHTFGNTFIWGKIYGNRVMALDGYLLVKSGVEEHSRKYYYPSGKGDIRPIIEALMQDAKDCGHPFEMFGVTPENMAELEGAFPGQFVYEDIRDIHDYVYNLEALSTLAGKKLHAKRNHINRFLENNEGWAFEPINSENLHECIEMNEEWCKLNCVTESHKQEYCAVRRSLAYFDRLGFDGGLLRVDGKVVAFTIGEVLNSDTYCTHIEKAFGEIQGAYPMINREFARHILSLYPHLSYVNREEDVGSEGLRKAKLSYYPEMMVQKGKVSLK